MLSAPPPSCCSEIVLPAAPALRLIRSASDTTERPICLIATSCNTEKGGYCVRVGNKKNKIQRAKKKKKIAKCYLSSCNERIKYNKV